MKRNLLLGAMLALCCGCATTSNAGADAVGGGIIGGLLGTGIGAICHAPVAGALIGAGAGALAGGAVGAAEDRREERRAEVQQAAAISAAQHAAARAPGYEEIVQMTRANVPEDNIIAQIRNSGAAYNPNSNDLMYLSQNGVSPRVISAVQTQTGSVVYAPAPVYVYDPYPRPAVGVVYTRGWR